MSILYKVIHRVSYCILKVNCLPSTGIMSLSTAALPQPINEPKIHETGIFINNQWLKSISGKTFPTINPATGEVITEIQRGEKVDYFLMVSGPNVLNTDRL